MKVVIIGTGNVATILGRKILESPHDLVQIVGRTPMHAQKLGHQLNVPFTSPASTINKNADLYIVAISDDALTAVGEWLFLDKKLVVHTAGSVSMNVLQSVSKNYGVLYPLQSLNAESVELPEVPFLVDGSSPDDLALINDFASSISTSVQVSTDEARKKLHLAAVIVNNFTNHLYALAGNYCKQEQLDFNLLLPLIKETANRISYLTATDAQTGPAARNDTTTIKKHLELLKDHPGLKKIYEEMTRSITEANSPRSVVRRRS
jgi:predicted short-subunit dehydrogenase-like oxidoreductase (DUF2520 family)